MAARQARIPPSGAESNGICRPLGIPSQYSEWLTPQPGSLHGLQQGGDFPDFFADVLVGAFREFYDLEARGDPVSLGQALVREGAVLKILERIQAPGRFVRRVLEEARAARGIGSLDLGAAAGLQDAVQLVHEMNPVGDMLDDVEGQDLFDREIFP